MKQRLATQHATTIASQAEKRYGCDKHLDKNAYHNAGHQRLTPHSPAEVLSYFDNQNREQYAAGHKAHGDKGRRRDEY